MARLFYFGCRREKGHYLHQPEGAVCAIKLRDTPWGAKLDGALCPKGPQVQGVTALHHLDGWTAVAFWDRSVDSRENSCSVFLTDCITDETELLTVAAKAFPDVFARCGFPLAVPHV